MSAFAGRTVVITGAASGIGAAAASAFAGAGARVAVVDIDAQGAEAHAAALPAAIGVHADITDAGMLTAMVDRVEAELGPIDVLVNNAMLCQAPPFLESTPEQIRRDIDVTLVGTMLCTRAVLPGMLQRGSGRIINISSVNGLAYFGDMSYSAAKAGVISFTRSIAVEFGGRGIVCNAIAPGTVATGYWQERARTDPKVLDKAAHWYPAGRIGAPEDIVSAILYLSSTDTTWVNGHTLVVDGGLTAGDRHMARQIAPDV